MTPKLQQKPLGSPLDAQLAHGEALMAVVQSAKQWAHTFGPVGHLEASDMLAAAVERLEALEAEQGR